MLELYFGGIKYAVKLHLYPSVFSVYTPWCCLQLKTITARRVGKLKNKYQMSLAYRSLEAHRVYCLNAYLNYPTDMHFCYHLCSVKKHQQSIKSKCHILERRIMLEGFWSVHTHRNNTDDGTNS